MANFLDTLKNALASWAQRNPQQAQNVLKLERPVNQVKQAIVNTPSYLLQGAKNVAIQAPKQANLFGQRIGTAVTAPFDFNNMQSMNKTDTGIADKYVKTAIAIRQTNPYMSKRLFDRARELSQGTAQRAQSMSDILGKQKKELVSSGVNTGLYALGGPTSIQNPVATSVASIIGGGLNKVMGGSYKEGVIKGVDTATKFNAIAPLTNPVISGVTGKVKSLIDNPIARQVVGRTLSGLGAVGENELLAKLDQQNITNKDRLISFGIGAVLSSGGKPEDWSKLKNETKQLVIDGGKIFGLDTRPAGDVWVGVSEKKYANMPAFLYEKINHLKEGDYPMGLSVKALKPYESPTYIKSVNEAVKSGKVNPQEADMLLNEGRTLQPKPPVQGGVKGSTPVNTREILSTLAEKKGVITNEQVLKASKEIKGQRITAVSEQRKLAELARIQSIRNQAEKDFQNFTNAQKTNDVGNLDSLWNKAVNTFKAFKSEDSLSGQRLQASQIEGNATLSPINKVLGMLKTAGVDIENQSVKDAGLAVDWNNPNQVHDFYRTFAPAKAGEWLDAYRYNNMLSNPGTLEGNLESNVVGSAVVAPVQKTIQGMLSGIKSKLTGTPQTQFAGEGAAYAKGYFSKEGLQAATKSFKHAYQLGMDELVNSDDIEKFGQGSRTLSKSGTIARKAETAIKVFTNFLKGTDNFFTELSKRGVQKSLEYRSQKTGIDIPNIGDVSYQEAKDILFNAPLGTKNQGLVNNAIDAMSGHVKNFTQSKSPLISIPAKMTMPFIKIATNLLKSSVDFSPIGYVNSLSAEDKLAKFTRATIGTGTIMALTPFAMGDNITLSAPTSQKERDLWTAAGKQPNSIKIGDKWYSYMRFHPAIQSPIIFAGAYAKAMKDPKNLDKAYIEKIGQAFGTWWVEQTQQTYLKNVGDFVKVLSGSENMAASAIANYPKQFAPFNGFLNWANIALDNTKRRVASDADMMTKVLQSIKIGIPFLSQSVPPVLDQMGNEVPKNAPGDTAWNMLTAEKRTTINPMNNDILNQYNQRTNQEKTKKSMLDILKNGGTPTSNISSQAGVQTTGDPTIDLLVKQKAEKARISTITDILTRSGAYKDIPQGTAQTQKLLQMESVTPQEINDAKINSLKSLGTSETVQYIKSQPSVDFTALYKQGVLTPAVAQEMERQGFIPNADQLIKNMKLTDVYQQNKALRKIGTSSMKKILSLQKKTMKSILNRKTKTIKYKVSKLPKMKKIKVKSYKFPKIKVKL